MLFFIQAVQILPVMKVNLLLKISMHSKKININKLKNIYCKEEEVLGVVKELPIGKKMMQKEIMMETMQWMFKRVLKLKL